ncbi:MAG: protein translocase subunit SecF [Patescibacteria group bacterium]
MLKIYTTMFWFSITLVLASVVLVSLYGLNFGVDFKGGTVIELNFDKNRPTTSEIQKTLSNFPDMLVSSIGSDNTIIRTKDLTEDKHQEILAVLRGTFPDSVFREDRFDSVGPVIGNELKRKSTTAIILVLAAVTCYIAIVFRKLSRTLSPWSMGLAAIVALLHDVIIPVGVFAVLGYFYGIEINAVFVAAVLTILGYSVADTVVVFDRVRENVIRGSSSSQVMDFPEVVHKSILQTLTRSLNTTFTTLLSLFAIYFFGGESIRYFALALIIGIFLGAYSSIFVASPLLVWLSKNR